MYASRAALFPPKQRNHHLTACTSLSVVGESEHLVRRTVGVVGHHDAVVVLAHLENAEFLLTAPVLAAREIELVFEDVVDSPLLAIGRARDRRELCCELRLRR